MSSTPRTLWFQSNSAFQVAQYAKLQLPDRGHCCQTRIAVHAAITTKATAAHPFYLHVTNNVLLFF